MTWRTVCYYDGSWQKAGVTFVEAAPTQSKLGVMAILISSMITERSSTHTIPMRNSTVALASTHRTFVWNAGKNRV